VFVDDTIDSNRAEGECPEAHRYLWGHYRLDVAARAVREATAGAGTAVPPAPCVVASVPARSAGALRCRAHSSCAGPARPWTVRPAMAPGPLRRSHRAGGNGGAAASSVRCRADPDRLAHVTKRGSEVRGAKTVDYSASRCNLP
jgi:hypothetical protein